jgi:tRNA (guanine37-N1)-methyltransferase
MNIKIITIFPNIFDSYFNESIIKRAQTAELVKIEVFDLRQWTTDKHRSVDDTPYGGGAGMVMKIEPLYQALKHLTNQTLIGRVKDLISRPKRKVVLLSAKGATWTQGSAVNYSQLDELILICGRYEGVDERITNFIDEEISIGDFVMTGGELGAMVLVDTVVRLLPGALGNVASSVDESHSQQGVLEYPQYTRPAVFAVDGHSYAVPEVLLSGDHEKIALWRKENRRVK